MCMIQCSANDWENPLLQFHHNKNYETFTSSSFKRTNIYLKLCILLNSLLTRRYKKTTRSFSPFQTGTYTRWGKLRAKLLKDESERRRRKEARGALYKQSGWSSLRPGSIRKDPDSTYWSPSNDAEWKTHRTGEHASAFSSFSNHEPAWKTRDAAEGINSSPRLFQSANYRPRW